MERQSTPQGGDLQNSPTPPECLTDEQRIHYHITEALRENHPGDLLRGMEPRAELPTELPGGTASPKRTRTPHRQRRVRRQDG